MTENDDVKSIELYSDEIQEILVQIPKAIIRWGTLIIAVVLLFLIGGSAVLKYPDIIKASITLTTQTPPVKLFSKIDGKIEELFVTDKQIVKKGEIIALLETAAGYKDVFEAAGLTKRLISDIQKQEFSGLNKNYNLGEIQSYYSALMRQYIDYADFISLNYHQKKIKALKNELDRYNHYFRKLEEQSKIQEHEYLLSLKQFKRDSLLFKQGVTSTLDFEKSESTLMSKKFSYKEAETNLAEAKIDIIRLNQQIMELQLLENEEKKERENLVYEAYEKFQAEVEIWKQKYLLITPVDGSVSFTKFWSVNQQVNNGDPVVTIIPVNPGNIMGKILIGVDGAGKVKQGQIVNIKFHNYPFIEFGIVKGKIISISPVPERDYYSAEVELVNGLKTNYGKIIEFRQEMPGQAEIVTDDLSLLKRIINPLKSSFKEHL